jgi:hypothetical protein
MITCLPLLVLMFAYGCDQSGGYNPFSRLYNFIIHFNIQNVLNSLQTWHYGAALIYLAVIAQLAVYSKVLPGDEVQGVPLRDGSRLNYKVNGNHKFMCLYVCVF